MSEPVTTPKPKRRVGDLYADLFRPHVHTLPVTIPWVEPGEPEPEFYKRDPRTWPGPSICRPSQPWRGLAAVLRWLALRLLLWAKRAEARGLVEPEITERSMLDTLREFQRKAESFRAPAEDAA